MALKTSVKVLHTVIKTLLNRQFTSHYHYFITKWARLLYKQDSFITGVLSVASAAHCGAIWQMLMRSLVVSRGITFCCTVRTCKFSTSDLLHFLIYV